MRISIVCIASIVALCGEQDLSATKNIEENLKGRRLSTLSSITSI